MKKLLLRYKKIISYLVILVFFYFYYKSIMLTCFCDSGSGIVEHNSSNQETSIYFEASKAPEKRGFLERWVSNYLNQLFIDIILWLFFNQPLVFHCKISFPLEDRDNALFDVVLEPPL